MGAAGLFEGGLIGEAPTLLDRRIRRPSSERTSHARRRKQRECHQPRRESTSPAASATGRARLAALARGGSLAVCGPAKTHAPHDPCGWQPAVKSATASRSPKCSMPGRFVRWQYAARVSPRRDAEIGQRRRRAGPPTRCRGVRACSCRRRSAMGWPAWKSSQRAPPRRAAPADARSCSRAVVAVHELVRCWPGCSSQPLQTAHRLDLLVSEARYLLAPSGGSAARSSAGTAELREAHRLPIDEVQAARARRSSSR